MNEPTTEQTATPESYCKRDLRVRIQRGAYFDTTARGKSLAAIVNRALLSYFAVPQPIERGEEFSTLDIELKYWHLTDDLKCLKVSESITLWREVSINEQAVRDNVEALAKSFVLRLSKNDINLIGPDGTLEGSES